METENIDDIMKELDSSDFGEKDEVVLKVEKGKLVVEKI